MSATTPLTDGVRRSEIVQVIGGLDPELIHLSGGWAVGSKLEPHTS